MSKQSQEPKQNKSPEKPSPDSKPDVLEIKLSGGRKAAIKMFDSEGNHLPQLKIPDVPTTAIELIAVRLEEHGYQLAASNQSQKYDLGFERV